MAPSVSALEAALDRFQGRAPRDLPPQLTASQLELLARCQDLRSEDTLEPSGEVYWARCRPEEDDEEDVDVEALSENVLKSLEVLKWLAERGRNHKHMWEAEFAFYKELEGQHKARETELKDEVKNLQEVLLTSELNLAIARAEKEALANVLSEAKARGVAEYKKGPDFKEDLEQFVACCYKVGLGVGEDRGRKLASIEYAREAFEAAVGECRRRTQDMCYGPKVLAQTAHRFTGCERDREVQLCCGFECGSGLSWYLVLLGVEVELCSVEAVLKHPFEISLRLLCSHPFFAPSCSPAKNLQKPSAKPHPLEKKMASPRAQVSVQLTSDQLQRLAKIPICSGKSVEFSHLSGNLAWVEETLTSKLPNQLSLLKYHLQMLSFLPPPLFLSKMLPLRLYMKS
ncbi:hypothetical protein Taro_035557 [Colocasia esculenta]|uniref:Uncharacterized protein n=1 Tax=Colocasia esculenta TaxID=4460 RepID=A0A843W618_COLES|nr:hypothetical protein [Colocasia esculenta]